MNLLALTGEDRIFLGRIEDMFSEKRSSPSFTSFLTERQITIAKELIRQRRFEDNAIFDGGFSDAARQVLGVFPPNRPPDAALFPVRGITLLYRDSDAPTHRDFLGACMSLLIKRESIGDIMPDKGRCALFVLSSVAPVILDELRKVGGVGVRCENGIQGEIVQNQAFDTIHGTVPSLRMDCLVSLITNLARDKSAKLILSEMVQQNHATVTSISALFGENDTVTIRGHGKFIVDKIGGPTKKRRLTVDVRKYR